MTAPTYRRPRHRLSPIEIADLISMRDNGATWMEVGRVFGKQDAACKAIYDGAIRAGPGVAPRTPISSRP